jgi:hypothetical protein
MLQRKSFQVPQMTSKFHNSNNIYDTCVAKCAAPLTKLLLLFLHFWSSLCNFYKQASQLSMIPLLINTFDKIQFDIDTILITTRDSKFKEEKSILDLDTFFTTKSCHSLKYVVKLLYKCLNIFFNLTKSI